VFFVSEEKIRSRGRKGREGGREEGSFFPFTYRDRHEDIEEERER